MTVVLDLSVCLGILFGPRSSVSFSASANSTLKQAKLPLPFVSVSTRTNFRPTRGPYGNIENNAP